MITVDAVRCSYCGGCVSVCPEDAIYLAETRLIIDQACTECCLCLAACPVGALQQTGAAPVDVQSRIGSRYDVVVVGAGPAGSTAAGQAAELGLSVLLLEKRQEIGSPVRCAEGVPHDALASFLEPDPIWISARVDQAQIVARIHGQVMVCAQYLLAGIDWNPACLGYWIDAEVAPGGYAWVFPKGDGRANVGLGIQADLGDRTALAYLNCFVEGEAGLAAGSPVALVAGNVPVALSCPSLVAVGLMLVGDAARQVDPLTGGGIINAMTAGRLAPQVAADALAKGDVSRRELAVYQDEANELLGRRLVRSYRLRQRFPPERRASREFVRLFAVAAGGK